MQQTAQVLSPMSMSQRLRWAMAGSLCDAVCSWSCLGSWAGSGLRGLDEAEGQQPGRLAVVAGAVGLDKTAVGGLTAAVLLDLALELLHGGPSHAVHLLPWWLLAVGGASVHGEVPGSRPPTRPLSGGTLGSAGGCRSPRLAFVGGLGLLGVGDLQGARRAQPDDDVGSWVLPGRADVGLHQRRSGGRVAAQRARPGNRPRCAHRRPPSGVR